MGDGFPDFLSQFFDKKNGYHKDSKYPPVLPADANCVEYFLQEGDVNKKANENDFQNDAPDDEFITEKAHFESRVFLAAPCKYIGYLHHDDTGKNHCNGF